MPGKTLVIVSLLAAVAMPATAQEPYPVSVGFGGGIQGPGDQYYHGMAMVIITPPRSPILFRLDGVAGKRGRSRVTGLSASTMIVLRPWRVAPYLIVGSSRTSSTGYPYDFAGWAYARPRRTTTELTGGLGLKYRRGSQTILTEMRYLGEVGAALTIGFAF